MTSRSLIILGATGDLTSRLLLPALDGVLKQFDTESHDLVLELVGSGNDPEGERAWSAALSSALGIGTVRDAVLATARFEVVDATSPEDLRRVIAGAAHTPILYFALPPAVTEQAIEALGSLELPEGTRLALEKPFARDAESAAALNNRLSQVVPESRIYRVDHFLGKSTVINLLGLRFANRMFEAVWNAEHIERVEIIYDEQLALEGRAGYYDEAGALVDMIQSHLLLVLALVVMEKPQTIESGDLHDAMAEALAQTRVVGGDPVKGSRRARYTAGVIDDRPIPDYAAEDGVDAARQTETLAELTVEVDAPRWRGVPITLRSGKAIGQPATEVRLLLRPVDERPGGLLGELPPAEIRISLSPEHLAVDLDINGEGDPFDLDRVTLDVDFGGGELTAYGEVIAGILDGDDTLSVRGDLAEQCWRIVDEVLDAWRAGAVPLEEYPAGSDGPVRWRRDRTSA